MILVVGCLIVQNFVIHSIFISIGARHPLELFPSLLKFPPELRLIFPFGMRIRERLNMSAMGVLPASVGEGALLGRISFGSGVEVGISDEDVVSSIHGMDYN